MTCREVCAVYRGDIIRTHANTICMEDGCALETVDTHADGTRPE